MDPRLGGPFKAKRCLAGIIQAPGNACQAAIAIKLENARNRQWIAGIKARLSRSVAGENDLVEALRRARQVADPLKIPIMVHIGDTRAPLPDILALLQAGDIVTYVYSPPPHGIQDDRGKVLPQPRGAPAGISVLDLKEGDFEFADNSDANRTGHRKLLPYATILGGKRVA